MKFFLKLIERRKKEYQAAMVPVSNSRGLFACVWEGRSNPPSLPPSLSLLVGCVMRYDLKNADVWLQCRMASGHSSATIGGRLQAESSLACLLEYRTLHCARMTPLYTLLHPGWHWKLPTLAG